VLAVPNAALRTARDVGSAAQVLGLSPAAVQQQLAAARPANDSASRATIKDSSTRASMGAAPPAGGSDRTGRAGAGRRNRGQAQGVGSRYIVFVKRNTQVTPVWIRTGLTDLDYSEVLEGLTPSDSVLVLPSAGLVQSQQDMRERFNRVTGGGAVPGMRQQTAQPSTSTRP